MIAFLARRLLQAILVMLVVGMVAFMMFRYIGDPINNMLGEEATREQRKELRERLGLGNPFIIQFGNFIINACQGEFGISYRNNRAVGALIRERLPATLELTLAAGLLSIVIAIPLGVFSALKRDSLVSHIVQAVSLIGISLPTFVTGILLILIFSVKFNLLPSFGRGEVVHLGCGRLVC